MAYGLPNGHVTDDVTWPWKVKLVTPIRSERNISKTTWARDLSLLFDCRVLQWQWSTVTLWVSTVGYYSDTAWLFVWSWRRLQLPFRLNIQV